MGLLGHTWPWSMCQPASLLVRGEGPGDRCREPILGLRANTGCVTSPENVACSFSRVLDTYFPRRFIEEKSSFEYGQVNHALAAAMRTLVKEYLILVTQLEQLQRQGLLSLQKLWFYVQPAMRTVDILASLGMCPPGQGSL